MTKVNTTPVLRTPVLGPNVNSTTQVIVTEMGSLKRDLGGLKSDLSTFKGGVNNVLTKMSSDISTFFVQLNDMSPEKINKYITDKLTFVQDDLSKMIKTNFSGLELSPEVSSVLVEKIRVDIEDKIKDVLDDPISKLIEEKLSAFGPSMQSAYTDLSSRLEELHSKLVPEIASIETALDNLMNSSMIEFKAKLEQALLSIDDLRTRCDNAYNVDVNHSNQLEVLHNGFQGVNSSIDELGSRVDSKCDDHENILKGHADDLDKHNKRLESCEAYLPNVALKNDVLALYEKVKADMAEFEIACKSSDADIIHALDLAKSEYRDMIENGLKDDGAVIGELVQVKGIVDEHSATIVSLSVDVGMNKNDVYDLGVNYNNLINNLGVVRNTVETLAQSLGIKVDATFVTGVEDRISELRSEIDELYSHKGDYLAEIKASETFLLKQIQPVVETLDSKVTEIQTYLSSLDMSQFKARVDEIEKECGLNAIHVDAIISTYLPQVESKLSDELSSVLRRLDEYETRLKIIEG